MTDDALGVICLVLAALSAVGVIALRHPDTFLSRLIDRPVDENTTEGAQP